MHVNQIENFCVRKMVDGQHTAEFYNLDGEVTRRLTVADPRRLGSR